MVTDIVASMSLTFCSVVTVFTRFTKDFVVFTIFEGFKCIRVAFTMYAVICLTHVLGILSLLFWVLKPF